MLGISFGPVQIILKDDFNIGRIVTKFMPQLLSEEQTIMSVLATTIKTSLKRPRYKYRFTLNVCMPCYAYKYVTDLIVTEINRH